MKRLLLVLAVSILIFPAVCFAESVTVLEAKGKVYMRRDPSMAWEKVSVRAQIPEGAEIMTKGGKSSVMVAFDRQGKSILTVESKTQVKVESVNPADVYLPQGRVFTLIEKGSAIKNFEVRTPTAVAGARGTGWMTEYANGETNVSCFDDVVSIASLDDQGNITGEIRLNEGFEIEVRDEMVEPRDIQEVSESNKQEWLGFVEAVEHVVPEIKIEGPMKERAPEMNPSMGNRGSETYPPMQPGEPGVMNSDYRGSMPPPPPGEGGFMPEKYYQDVNMGPADGTMGRPDGQHGDYPPPPEGFHEGSFFDAPGDYSGTMGSEGGYFHAPGDPSGTMGDGSYYDPNFQQGEFHEYKEDHYFEQQQNTTDQFGFGSTDPYAGMGSTDPNAGIGSTSGSSGVGTTGGSAN